MQFRLDVSETWCVILVNRSCYILFKNYRALYRETKIAGKRQECGLSFCDYYCKTGENIVYW
mgnify:FL=1